ncbi:hypothetical protein Agub_g2834 [Astrephomene gubernaculifera]|uniref:Uncharacterized protein n=1 Tax=Astrephomene gubernaculifera TaxID=47775 RepID=A0AAD3HIL2_9CHLO|nr:hypothetical protein Agub_g2834 [Astrephomene gubernaculifera]
MDHYTYPRGNEAAAAEVGPGKRRVPGPEERRGRTDLFDVVHHTCHLKPQEYTGGDRWLEARGKAHAPGPEQRRGRRDLSDVLLLKARAGSAEGSGGAGAVAGKGARAGAAAVGDMWLDAKGKAHAEGPEVRRGRAGLYDTLHQTSNPYEGGSKVGDAWLEHKGKKVLPQLPPEAGAALAGIPAPVVVRRLPDERVYGTHLTTIQGQLTVKQ